MTRRIVVDDLDGIRDLNEDDLPLAIGGRESSVRLPGAGSEQPAVWIACDGDAAFVQPAQGNVTRITCNGTPLTTSRWLHDGDVLTVGTARIAFADNGARLMFKVAEPSGDSTTGPPDVAPSLPHNQHTTTPTIVVPVKFSPATRKGKRRAVWRPRPGRIVETVLLLALAAAVWFVFTARSVEVDIEPLPHRIEFRGGLPAISIAGRFVLRPGKYSLVAERTGYRTLDVPIVITRESGQQLRFELEQLPGLLDVSSGEVEGAEVSVDGNMVGTTPLVAVELTVGTHDILVQAHRFQDYTTTLTVEGPGSTHSLTVELVPAWADVTFRSRPAGAMVRLGGSRVGSTPLTTEVVAGSHSVEFALAGYKPHRRRIDVIANEPQELPVVSLVPSDGNLSVLSDPSEALVAINGAFRGSTPLDIELAPGTDYEITVSKSGYDGQSERVRIESGETRRLTFSLKQRVGEVTINSRPQNAQLLVDGEVRGSTGQTLQLTAAAHEIEVRMEGYESFRTTVTPQQGVPESLEVTLQPVGTTTGLSAVAQTPQGVEMKLIAPGRFSMGASRREPGRRANETLREVEVTRRFYLATREVSNREFRQFASQHRSGTAGRHSLETDHHPVVRVTWDEAARYCNWLSEQQGLPPVYVERDGVMTARSPLPAGYRLPTEAEWAWAARVPSGTAPLKYAWGNNLPIPEGTDNYGDQSAGGLLGGSLPDYSDSEPVTAPVGSFQPNARGLFNMGGNVSEWVHDIYTIYPSSGSVDTDPTGPPQGKYHVIRGASWMDDSVSELRLSYRDYGDKRRSDVGFRVARTAE